MSNCDHTCGGRIERLTLESGVDVTHVTDLRTVVGPVTAHVRCSGCQEVVTGRMPAGARMVVFSAVEPGVEE